MTSTRHIVRLAALSIAMPWLCHVAVAQSASAAPKRAEPAAPAAPAAERSMLRITCDGPNANAEVTINGDFKGECPLDVPVPAGTVELRAVRKVSPTHERVYERTFRVGAGVGKREEIELGDAQLSADGVRVLAEQQKRREAVAAERAAEQRRAALDAEQAFVGLQARAEGGDVPSMSLLAAQIDVGRGVDPTPQRATAWYLKAAIAGDPQAMFRTARRLENGFGVAKDLKAASGWYRKAADAGNAGGLGGLAAFAFNGWGEFAARDPELARTFAEKAAAAGDPRGMHVMGVLHIEGKGGLPKDPTGVPSGPSASEPPGAAWLSRAADLGERRSMAVQASQLSYNRVATSPDLVRAAALARRAAEPGDDGAPGIASAMTLLGKLNEHGGGGFAKAPLQALPWYRKAADLGWPEAEHSLASMLFLGQGGVALDETAAYSLFLRAAQQGHGEAMNTLGYIHQRGIAGQTVNKEVAASWYRKAEAAGAPTAKANLKSLGWFY